MATQVVHLMRDTFDVRIDRKSKWGNPFVIGRDGDRNAVIAKYHQWILTQPNLVAAIGELKDKRLGCWNDCHGDILAMLADQLTTN
jgi:hypothetical protein